jgi:hypothetical protein
MSAAAKTMHKGILLAEAPLPSTCVERDGLNPLQRPSTEVYAADGSATGY